MLGVRNYGFPGFFNEANPESSTRNTGTNYFTSNLSRPRMTQLYRREVAAPRTVAP